MRILFSINARFSYLPFRKHTNYGIHLLLPEHERQNSESQAFPECWIQLNTGRCCWALFPTEVLRCHHLSRKRKEHPSMCKSYQKTGALGIKELFPWEKHSQPLAHNGLKGQWPFLRHTRALVSRTHSCAWVSMVRIKEQGWGWGNVDQLFLLCLTCKGHRCLSFSLPS